MKRIVVRTGGQTGVDRAALAFAVRYGLDYGGWCPRGGWAEDHPQPPGLLPLYPRLMETPATVPEQRTAWNVRDSHATLILGRGQITNATPGTMFTLQCAELVFVRPFLCVDLTAVNAPETVSAWLERLFPAVQGPELWLNIAGPRESECQGIQAETEAFLGRVLPSQM